ncbi:MAG: DNA repair protein RadC [Bacteroidales bacterium]|nr:DNA repair protein RadC [Bacteroidales bacterium]
MGTAKRRKRGLEDLPEDCKPRERAEQYGIQALQNHELIAIILGSGIKGKNVIELSQEILRTCGHSLAQLAQMSIQEMKAAFGGIGQAKAIALAAAMALGKRAQAEKGPDYVTVDTPDVAYNYIRAEVEDLDHEEFWIICVNRANRIKGKYRISHGGTAATVVDAKIVFRTAIEKLAQGIVLVHNHPSGNLRPSNEDDNLTKRLKAAGDLLDIRVLDHLIITSTSFYSYHNAGKL